MTAAAEILVLLDGYGSPAPSLLPWLARWAATGDLLQVARAAAAQAALTPMLRWPAVADAVAEVLARRVTERSALVPPLAEVLPQITASLDTAQLATAPRGEALGYAALAQPGAGLIDRARRELAAAPWPEILTAARSRAVPPLANLRLLARLVAGPGELLGSEAAYLLPFLRDEPGLAEDTVAEIEEYLPVEPGWYASALCARAVPYLDQSQRARLSESAGAAPPAWAAVVRQLAEHDRGPWPSASAELAASHPAMTRLTKLAEDADQAELTAACAQVIERILREYGDPDLEAWRSAEPGLAEPGLAGAPAPAITPGFWGESGQKALVVPDDVAVPVRYLVGDCPATVRAGSTFSLRVCIALSDARGVPLLPFDVPAEGRDVRLMLVAPGLRVLGEQWQNLRVPRDEDSGWAEFSLRADTPGKQSISVIALVDGTYLGCLPFDVTIGLGGQTGPSRRVRGEMEIVPVAGAVALMARYEPPELYRFQFIAEDFPDEVRHQLRFDPQDSIEDLIQALDELARGRRVYDGKTARYFLANKGAELWHNLVPRELHGQFWERHADIVQLTILADNDVVPWEVLYPKDDGHDHGFLVEQFPVTRAIFNRGRPHRLRLRPTRFVLPPKSPPQAVREVETLRELLGETSPDAVVTELSELLDLLRAGDFGVLHFACHNTFDPVAGSAIRFDRQLFKPDMLTLIAVDKALKDSAPLVFINACRAGGLAVSYNKLEGWATKFMEAGAAAFIGSQWAVADDTAPEFAVQFYLRLREGRPLGQAVQEARRAVSADTDPTWLAYSVYGNPSATVGEPHIS